MLDLDVRAVEILKTNDRGGFTVPTARLYPYQWNWDSAFAALGFATVDMDRAWQELETLFEGQWPNGMVPHIIFRRDDPDYFPGPSVWGSGTEPPSSGHSQPPVAATVVRDLYERDPTAGRARMAALFPAMLAWHRWFHQTRDPEGRGVILATHPWETGRDNAPDWDAAMADITPEGIAPYTRRDTSHVDPSMRPTKDDYDRFLFMVQWGREAAWDHARITSEGPFAVADPGLTFILLRADRDLLAMAETLGETDAATEISGWIAKADEGVRWMWSEELGGYVSRNARTSAFAEGLSSVAFLAFYAKVFDAARDPRLIETFDAMTGAAGFAVPSYDPRAKGFDSKRYWRGPAWAVVNYMIGRGLAEAGHSVQADRVRNDTRRLIETAGFHEYFDPTDGSGCGGDDFTWTAAVWLAWARSEA